MDLCSCLAVFSHEGNMTLGNKQRIFVKKKTLKIHAVVL